MKSLNLLKFVACTMILASISCLCFVVAQTEPHDMGLMREIKGKNIFRSLAIHPDALFVALGTARGTIEIYDISTGIQELTLAGHQHSVWSLSYSPDGKYLASGSEDGTVIIWDMQNRAVAYAMAVHQRRISSVIYSPDGRYLASASWDKTIRIWDTQNGREIQTLIPEFNRKEGVFEVVLALDYSPSGQYIAASLGDYTIQIWDTESGEEIQTLVGHEDSIYSINYSPDGRYIASGSADATIRIWDVESGEMIRTFYEEGTDSIYSLRYSPDGNYLVSGTWRTVKMWNVESGREVRRLVGGDLPVYFLEYSQDGHYLISGATKAMVGISTGNAGTEFIKIWASYDRIASLCPSGTCPTPDFQPHYATINIRSTSGAVVRIEGRSLPRDSSGIFSTQLEAGSYTVEVRKPGYSSVSAVISVVANQELNLELPLLGTSLSPSDTTDLCENNSSDASVDNQTRIDVSVSTSDTSTMDSKVCHP